MMGITEDWLAGLGVPGYLVMFLSIVRWLLLIGIIMLALAALYRYGPNRQNPKWQWVSWGAIAATMLWLLATIAFFVYARYFAHFSDSYSLFAGIIVMMTWFNLSALTFLIGAEVNHNLEKQTNGDTTEN
jgi:membrane protein